MRYFSSGIEECIRNITFSYDETLMYGSIGLPASPYVELKNLTFWNSTVPVSYHGMCHTLLYPSLVAADTTSDAVYLALDPRLSYRLYLHDPTYHYLVMNPLVSPRIFRQFKDLTSNGGTYEWLYITATEKKNLNRESQPCEVNIYTMLLQSRQLGLEVSVYLNVLYGQAFKPCKTNLTQL